jgi:hypothetical protein
VSIRSERRSGLYASRETWLSHLAPIRAQSRRSKRRLSTPQLKNPTTGDTFGDEGFLHAMAATDAVVAATESTVWALDSDASPELEHWLALLRHRHALVAPSPVGF